MTAVAQQGLPDETITVYRAAGIVYRMATVDDNTVLQDILRNNAMESWVRLTMEHEPDYFAAGQLFGESHTLLAHRENQPNEIVGMCAWTLLPGHVNGKTTITGYLGELRVQPAFRHRLSVIRNGFRAVQQFSAAQSPPFWFTSIAGENLAAKRLLEAQLPGLPVYLPRGEMNTLAFPAYQCKSSSLWQAATTADIPALVEFYNAQQQQWQFAPQLTSAWLQQLDGSNGLQLQDFYLLKRDGRITACVALWDQRRFKQTVVRGYRFPLNLLRPIYNLYAGAAGRVSLPVAGKQIDYLFLAFLAVDESEQHLITNLIQEALSLVKQRNVALAMLGLAKDNPLLGKLIRQPHELYVTTIDSVDWPGEAAAALDNRPAQPEIALL